MHLPSSGRFAYADRTCSMVYTAEFIGLAAYRPVLIDPSGRWLRDLDGPRSRSDEGPNGHIPSAGHGPQLHAEERLPCADTKADPLRQTGTLNRRIVLIARPNGPRTTQDFRLEHGPMPRPSRGQVLLRTLYLSLTHTCAVA